MLLFGIQIAVKNGKIAIHLCVRSPQEVVKGRGACHTHGYQQRAINVANVRNVKPPTAVVGFAFGPGLNNGAGNWKLN